jgi:hypothetical protein
MFHLVNTLADTNVDQYSLLGGQQGYGQHYTSLRKGDSHLKHNSLISTIPLLTLLTPTLGRISITQVPLASLWVVALHSLFLYRDLPPPCHPPDWLRLFSSQTFYRINTAAILPWLFFMPTHLWRRSWQSVLNHWHINFRCQRTSQSKAYSITIDLAMTGVRQDYSDSAELWIT